MEYELVKVADDSFDTSFLSQQYEYFHRRFITQQNNAIKKALTENGFDVSDLEFLKENFQFIEREGDNFKHLYFHFGMDNEKRIISIQKTPDIIYEDDYRKITATSKIY